MDREKVMAPVPWYMLSPSFVSVAVYAVMILWGIPHLSRGFPYRRARRFSAFIDLVFVVGLMVFLTDLFWCLASFARWVPLYPEETLNVLTYIGRDVAGLALCYMMSYHLFDYGIFLFTRRFLAFAALDLAFKFVWFFLAPSLAWTDYTFAFRNDYSLDVVLGSFLISHFIGRLTFAGIYLSVWNPVYVRVPKCHAENQNTKQKHRQKDTARSHTEKESLPSERGKAAIPLMRNSLL